MSQTPRSKPPLDVLQSMINGILIETGRALRSSDKEGGRPLANAATRLRSTIPSAVENFHQALDDIEYEILRAKAVMLRDLGELRAKRLALESPVQIIEEETQRSAVPIDSNTAATDNHQTMPVSKTEEEMPQPGMLRISEQDNTSKPSVPTKNAPIPFMSELKDDSKANPPPTPPQSSMEAGSGSQLVGLGITTEGIPAEPGPDTAPPDSANDSLFGFPDDDDEDNNNKKNNIDLDLGNIDFPVQDTATDTQNQDQSQTQQNDFDLATFGDPSQDFNLSALQSSNDQNITDLTKKNIDKEADDDLFDLGSTTRDNMDIDLEFDIGGAGNNTFEDMFYVGGDDSGIGGGEIEHGDFDDAFFGI